MIRGTLQFIAGKPHIVGKPDSWAAGFDDWELREGDRITLEREGPNPAADCLARYKDDELAARVAGRAFRLVDALLILSRQGEPIPPPYRELLKNVAFAIVEYARNT